MDTTADWLSLIVAALALWRVSHLLVAEDGPWRLSARLRARASQNELGQVLDCLACTSLWLAAPVAIWLGRDWLMQDWPMIALLWLALSGAAVLLERATQTPLVIEPGWDRSEQP